MGGWEVSNLKFGKNPCVSSNQAKLRPWLSLPLFGYNKNHIKPSMKGDNLLYCICQLCSYSLSLCVTKNSINIHESDSGQHTCCQFCTYLMSQYFIYFFYKARLLVSSLHSSANGTFRGRRAEIRTRACHTNMPTH